MKQETIVVGLTHLRAVGNIVFLMRVAARHAALAAGGDVHGCARAVRVVDSSAEGRTIQQVLQRQRRRFAEAAVAGLSAVSAVGCWRCWIGCAASSGQRPDAGQPARRAPGDAAVLPRLTNWQSTAWLAASRLSDPSSSRRSMVAAVSRPIS